jgi:ABC-type bacteriocin/lantibiotic exporter with double-glycine peptidase domain
MSKSLYFPDILQNTCYNCGVVCVQAVLAYYGIEYTEPKLEKLLRTDKKWGTSIGPIIKFFRYKEFKVDYGSFTIQMVKEFIHRKIPVIILIQAWGPDGIDYKHTNQYGHYVVVSGYNDKGLTIEDPAIFGRGFISYRHLKERWHAEDIHPVSNFGIAVWGQTPYNYESLYKIG